METTLMALRSHGAATVHRGASKEDIRQFARIVKARLPSTFVEFLMQCGWVDLNGDVIYGLGPDATKATSLLEATVREHVRMDPQMLSYLIPLMADGAGNHECLDTRKHIGGDCRVVLWEHDHPRGEWQSPRLVSKSFAAWLRRKLRETPDN